MARKRPIVVPDREVAGGIEALIRIGRNIPMQEHFSLAKEGGERLLAEVILETASRLRPDMIGQTWDEQTRRYVQRSVGTGQEATGEELAWLLLVHLAALFDGEDPNWKGRLGRHRRGHHSTVDQQLELRARDHRVLSELQELESKGMQRTAAVSELAEQLNLAEDTIFEIIASARSEPEG